MTVRRDWRPKKSYNERDFSEMEKSKITSIALWSGKPASILSDKDKLGMMVIYKKKVSNYFLTLI